MKKSLCFLLIVLLLGCLPNATLAEGVPSNAIRYDANGGFSDAFGSRYDQRIFGTHLTENTLQGAGYFKRNGSVLLGWNTAPDGSGRSCGLGSRIPFSAGLTLYAEWISESPITSFQYRTDAGTVSITSADSLDVCVIPEAIDGLPVTNIAYGAFRDMHLSLLVFPASLLSVEDGAFVNCTIDRLVLFDRLQTVSDASFEDSVIHSLRINAALQPVYSSSYYAAFSDKFDYLCSLTGQKKLILFSGSSGRYGYDSAAIEASFREYRVANMGVYAYTNALPQYDLIRTALEPGDLLLVAPEFDAVREQFCMTDRLDPSFWAMMESNYDLVSRLELSDYSEVFDSFAAYQTTRAKMATKNYAETPAAYDDEGEHYNFSTYNTYGDFILPRPNSARDELHRHNIADYTTETVTPEAVHALNLVLNPFRADGIDVFFTYAPRNRSSLTERSTPEAFREVDALLRSTLTVPVISRIEDSLLSGVYFWEIDNHLSTEGVQIRTRQVIRDLDAALHGTTAGNGIRLEGGLRHPLAWIPFAMSLFCLLIAAFVRKLRLLSWVGAGLWAIGTVTSLICGAELMHILLVTLGLLIAKAYVTKRGDAS